VTVNLHDPTDLFFEQLRELYSAESQVILTLPELAECASLPDLRGLLLKHEGESIRHKAVIAGIFDRHATDPDGEICKAVRGLIKGCNHHLAMAEDSRIRDLLVVAHCNRIEHYEIAAYGFTLSLAECVGLQKDSDDLLGVLQEEREMSRGLAEVTKNILGSPVPAVTESGSRATS
jgi:ferritin-like metal-binding protein YciE